MNIDFEKYKKQIQNDTIILQNILNDTNNIDINNLLNSLDSSWYKPFLNLAIENNDSLIIQKILVKSDSNLNSDLQSKRDINRKKLLKVFFSKSNLY